MEMGLVHRNEVVCIRCEYCGSKEMKAWWPSADTGAYTCMNLDCSDEEYIKSRGKGRSLQYPGG